MTRCTPDDRIDRAWSRRFLSAVLLALAASASAAHADVFSCDEAGLDAAIAAGGGPHTFSCVGPTSIGTSETKVFTTDVVLDGDGLVSVGNAGGSPPPSPHRMFTVPAGVAVELRNLTVQEGWDLAGVAGAILNDGDLTLAGCTLRSNYAPGGSCDTSPCIFAGAIVSGSIDAGASLAMIDTTVEENSAEASGTDMAVGGVGIAGGTASIANSTFVANQASEGGLISIGAIAASGGSVLVSNSTISGNHAAGSFAAGGLFGGSALEVRNSTIAANTVPDSPGAGSAFYGSGYLLAGTLISGTCAAVPGPPGGVSLGGNVESPGDTCNLSKPSDQANVSEAALALGPLQQNGGATETHALGPASVALDAVADCPPPTTDQRGVPRPQGVACDTGSFERGVASVPLLGAPALGALALFLGASGIWRMRRERA